MSDATTIEQMLKALEALGYDEPLCSERYKAYRAAGIHKDAYHRLDYRAATLYQQQRKATCSEISSLPLLQSGSSA